jgi:hypothetical protein
MSRMPDKRRHELCNSSSTTQAERPSRESPSEPSAIFKTHETPLRVVANQLNEWAAYQGSGMAAVKPFEVRFRIEAVTDIIEQVQQLLKDQTVHPAAPIVLAGASLEEFLRSMQLDSGEPLVGKPGISAYADALRNAELTSRGEFKDITAWAHLRNEAAHGHFDDLNRERALLMVEGINLFISKHSDS